MMSPNLDSNEINCSLNNPSSSNISTRLNQGLLSTFQRKRRHLFEVELKIERVLSLPYANGKFFFKIRLLNGGHHVYICPNRIEVNENKVEFNLVNNFLVKINSRLDDFTLDHCFCRISIRKEGRPGRSFEKIGYYDLDLASSAGSVDESKACLLNRYQQTNTNPANAYLEIRMKIIIVDGDHIFRRPNRDDDGLTSFPPSVNSTNFQKILDSTNRKSSTINEKKMNLSINQVRCHSRQESKSSVCSINSNQSGNSFHQTTNSSSQEKPLNKSSLTKTTSDEDLTSQEQRRLIDKRRSPFIDQFGDIEKRLQSTRVDVNQLVNSVINENENLNDQNEGYLCLLYNDDGTTRLTSSSICQSISN